MSHKDAIKEIQSQVSEAFENHQGLHIIGGGSKSFYGNDLRLDELGLRDLEVNGLEGIIQYEPGELVIQVGAGTKIVDVISLLDKNDQMLAFEAPAFNGEATFGGMVVSGISGSRRPYTGAVRDYVLGVDIVDGQGQHLSFGGQVMKNVAGYDVSRLLVGSMGCLGVVTELSLKILPKPKCESTKGLEVTSVIALKIMNSLQTDYPTVSASAYFDGRLYARFSGMENSVMKAANKFGGESVDNKLWKEIDNLECFEENHMLWRLSITPNSKLFLDDAVLVDWAGGQRWLVDPDMNPREVLSASGESGHLTLVRRKNKDKSDTPFYPPFHPLNPILLNLHSGLKKQFDPRGILNPQKMHEYF